MERKSDSSREESQSPQMFDFKPDAALNPVELYRQLFDAADALTADEPDGVANMANVAALIWEFLPDLNWAGFYRVGAALKGGDELILGPFIGRPACIRIPFGQGVCGAAASTGKTQRIANVHAFPGHIACDALSQSELVVPILRNETVVAVIDLDSPRLDRFSAEDAEGIERLGMLMQDRI